MTTTTALVPVEPEQTNGRKLPASVAKELAEDKGNFIRWLHENVKSKAMRALALEEAAFLFTYNRYQQMILRHRQLVEEYTEFQIRLLDKREERLNRRKLEGAQLKLALAETFQKTAQHLKATRQLILPSSQEEEKLKRLLAEEKRELLKQKIAQRLQRNVLRSAMAQATEQVKLRAEFRQYVEENVPDEPQRQEVFDHYDRLVYEATHRNGDGE